MLGTGATLQANYLAVSIEEFLIPVPPLPEQQRIVGILDEAFEGIATAKANAEKNLQNARAIFESHLQSVFTQRGEGWVEKTAWANSATSAMTTYGVTKLEDDQCETAFRIISSEQRSTSIV